MNRAVKLSSVSAESSDKISILLRDTVLLLCRNGFNFQLDIKVQGLIAITLDEKEIFLVKFDETAQKMLNDSGSCSSNNEINRSSMIQSCSTTGMGSQMARRVQGERNARRGKRRRLGDVERSHSPSDLVKSENDTVKELQLKVDTEVEEVEQNSPSPNVEGNIQDTRMFLNPVSPYSTAENPFRSPCAFDERGLGQVAQAEVEDGCRVQGVVQLSCSGSSSTVTVKEESNIIDFNFAAFTGADCIDNLSLTGQVSLFGGGVEGVGGDGDRSLSNQNINDHQLSMPYGSLSGRGRRARRSGQKLYSCEHPDCGLSFYRSYTLYRHQRLKHGQRLVPPVNQLNKISEFRCNIEGCGQVFVRASTLERHEREVHGKQDSQHLMNSENILNKNDLERYDDHDLMFDGMDYSLLMRQNVT